MSFAYLFERFPSFTQTFCSREVEEMFRQHMAPLVFSIRSATESTESDIPPELKARIIYLPEEDALRDAMRDFRAEQKIPSEVWQIFKTWGERGDKTRLYEAAWLGLALRERGVRHVHVHFAGIAARTAYWMRKFWGLDFSFTGHANDIFCETDFEIALSDLVDEARMAVTVTDFSRDWLREKFPAHAGKIHRVYNGIHVTRFSPAERAVEKPRIISVGRYIEKKGFGDLIEACRILRDRGVEFDCQIIGTGPLEGELQAGIEAAGLSDFVALTGPRREEEVLAMLRSAAVFALPCVREAGGGMDNLPTVIMEAMACGLPVVSTRIAGIPEMVRDGETGFLAGERSPGELADALFKLLSDAALAREFGQRGREVARSLFSTEITTRRLKQLLVGRARVRPPARAVLGDPNLALQYAAGLLGQPSAPSEK